MTAEIRTSEQDIRDLERQYWQALVDNDIDAVMHLSADPCIVTGAHGVGRFERKVFPEMMKAQSYQIRSFELSDEEVMVFDDRIAVIGYKVREEILVEGRPVILEAADSSTWIRRQGRWQCVQHSESIAGDAFGRDRQQGAVAGTGPQEPKAGRSGRGGERHPS